MRVAVLQSNYIPWKGYFDMIASVDVFVVLDTVQFTKNDWRNRNKIRTAVAGRDDATAWLTIPVRTAGRFGQIIADTEVDRSKRWADAHIARIEQEYSGAAHAATELPWLRERLHAVSEHRLLSDVNRDLITAVCSRLDITTTIIDARALPDADDANERLLVICRALDASTYVSGPAAASYLDVERFGRHDIDVEWFDYDGYTPYAQTAEPFIPAVSVIDTMLNTGPSARSVVVRTRSPHHPMRRAQPSAREKRCSDHAT